MRSRRLLWMGMKCEDPYIIGDLWGKDRGRTDAGAQRPMELTEGRKAGIGGMRDTPDGLYVSPMVLEEAQRGLQGRYVGMVLRRQPYGVAKEPEP